MKKIIASALSAAILAASVSALASGRSQSISDAARDTSEIDILYNDTIVTYEDVKPQNNDGRVMIPFRAALESMGASIDYDADTRLVTAQKGDTAIRFTLMDDTIYVSGGDGEREIKMDVPMMVKDDRTLVPIRFMSEALGMNVGWDGDTQTVVIMDYDSYYDELKDAAPNITLLTELSKGVKSRRRTLFDFTSAREQFKPLTVSASAESVSDGIGQELMMQLSAGNEKFSVENATAHVILDGMTLYVQTDALKTIAQSSANPLLQAMVLLISGDTWYRADLEELFDAADPDSIAAGIFKTVLSMKNPDVKAMLKAGADSDASYGEAVALAAKMDLYEALDGYVSVEMKDDGGYIAAVNITPDDFAKAVSAAGGSANGKDMSADIHVNIENSVSGQTTKGEFEITSSDMTVKLSVADEQSSDESAPVAEAPQESMDITEIVKALLF